MGSPAFTLPSKADVWKVVRGALVTAAGAGLTYLSTYLTGADFGALGVFLVPAFGAAIEFARRWLSDTTGHPNDQPSATTKYPAEMNL